MNIRAFAAKATCGQDELSMIRARMWPLGTFGRGKGLTSATTWWLSHSRVTAFEGRSPAASLSPPRLRRRQAVRCQASFFEASNFSHKALRNALYVKLAPLGLPVQTSNIQETKAKRLQSHDHPEKSAKISFGGDSAHEWPAWRGINRNVSRQRSDRHQCWAWITRARNNHNPAGFTLRSEAHCAAGAVAATTAGLILEPTHEQSTFSRYYAIRLCR